MHVRFYTSVAVLLAATVLLTPSSRAQSAPSVGCVRNTSDWEAGTAFTREGDTRECYVFYSPSFDGTINRVNVDGRDVLVYRASQRQASAMDEAAGIRRQYTVTTYRPRNRRFEVELWERHVSDGWEGSTAFGGMTVRRGSRSTTVRLVGSSGP